MPYSAKMPSWLAKNLLANIDHAAITGTSLIPHADVGFAESNVQRLDGAVAASACLNIRNPHKQPWIELVCVEMAIADGGRVSVAEVPVKTQIDTITIVGHSRKRGVVVGETRAIRSRKQVQQRKRWRVQTGTRDTY